MITFRLSKQHPTLFLRVHTLHATADGDVEAEKETRRKVEELKEVHLY